MIASESRTLSAACASCSILPPVVKCSWVPLALSYFVSTIIFKPESYVPEDQRAVNL